MDKTAVFRAYVKTIKTRNRAFGSPLQQQQQNETLLPGKRKPPRRDDFSRRAKDAVNDVAKLTDFLNRHRRDYADVQSFDQHTTLTDADRDKIDAGAQHILKTCGQQVTALRHALPAGDGGGQVDDHRRQIVRYVEWRLKSVAKLFAEMRATRAQRCADYENVSKLSNLMLGAVGHPSGKAAAAAAKTPAAVDYEAADRQYGVHRQDDELSPEELQMFEAENIEMYNELNQLSNEVCAPSPVCCTYDRRGGDTVGRGFVFFR